MEEERHGFMGTEGGGSRAPPPCCWPLPERLPIPACLSELATPPPLKVAPRPVWLNLARANNMGGRYRGGGLVRGTPSKKKTAARKKMARLESKS